MRIFLLLFAMVSISAFAATYKCDVAGQITYSDIPCQAGQTKPLNVQGGTGANSGGKQRPDDRMQSEKMKADGLRQQRLEKERAEQRARENAEMQEKNKKARCEFMANNRAFRRSYAEHCEGK